MKIKLMLILTIAAVLFAIAFIASCGDDDDEKQDYPDLANPCIRYFMQCNSLPADDAETQCGTYYDTGNNCLVQAADDLFACMNNDCDRWADCSATYETQADACL